MVHSIRFCKRGETCNSNMLETRENDYMQTKTYVLVRVHNSPLATFIGRQEQWMQQNNHEPGKCINSSARGRNANINQFQQSTFSKYERNAMRRTADTRRQTNDTLRCRNLMLKARMGILYGSQVICTMQELTSLVTHVKTWDWKRSNQPSNMKI